MPRISKNDKLSNRSISIDYSRLCWTVIITPLLKESKNEIQIL